MPILSKHIRTGTIAAADLAADSVEASEIAAGAVDTSELAAGAVTSAKMDDGLLRTATLTLTNAQIATIDDTPIAIVAAGGAGTVHIVDSAVVFYDYGGTQYTLTTDDVVIEYSGSTDIAVIMANASFVAAADYLGVVRPAVAVSVPVANKAIAIGTSGANAIGGGHADSTITVAVWYRTISSTALT
jgi:hypothetical protein